LSVSTPHVRSRPATRSAVPPSTETGANAGAGSTSGPYENPIRAPSSRAKYASGRSGSPWPSQFHGRCRIAQPRLASTGTQPTPSSQNSFQACALIRPRAHVP
jgi:hypothetical protein